MMTNTKKYFVKRMITAIHALLLVVLLTAPVYAEAVDMPVIGVSEISNEDMTVALSFRLGEATEDQLSAYGSWLADFEVEFNHDITLNSAGTADGYLSGQLDIVGDEWINIPSTEQLLSANAPMKTAEAAVKQKGMSSLVKLTYQNFYNKITTFNCGVYLSPEYVAANPDLVVTVKACIYNPDDPSQGIAISEPYVYSVGQDEATPAEEFTYSVLNGTYCTKRSK